MTIAAKPPEKDSFRASPANSSTRRDEPARFVNRELSWLAFNRRVLEEASNEAHPLLERVRFLAISASNLDEFFMVRVSGVIEQIEQGQTTPGMDGLTPSELLARIIQSTGEMSRDQEAAWLVLREKLKGVGVEIIERALWTDADLGQLERHFSSHIFPAATPIAINPSHPFPFIPNLALSLAAQLFRREDKQDLTGLVRIPGKFARYVRLQDGPNGALRFARVEDVIAQFLDQLFPGCDVGEIGVFRVVRDLDIEFAEDEEVEDLVSEFEAALKERRRGSVIRLEVNSATPLVLRDFIASQVEVSPKGIIVQNEKLALRDLSHIVGIDRADLKFQPYSARSPERISEFDGDCFAAIRAKDIIVQHPYESFDVVLQFLRQAARDPRVVSIKQNSLSHVFGQPHRLRLDGGRRKRQVGDCACRTEGAFRRGSQYPMGALDGAGRRPGGFWIPRSEDARQTLHGRPGRGKRRRRNILPYRHGQLPSHHSPHLH